MLATALAVSAQCEARTVSLASGAATLSGQTGGCNRYSFSISEGQRVKVTLTSTDGSARFDLQDGAEDETGAVLYSNRTSFDDVLTFTDFSIETKGSASTAFTLKITVSGE